MMHHTDAFGAEDLAQLIDEPDGPCVSIYLPTSAVSMDTARDRIVLKNARAEAFEVLTSRDLRRPDAERILEPVDELLEDESFWPYLSDGLAVFASPRFHAVYRLPERVDERVFVGDQFLLKPLIPLLTGHGAFYVLALSRNDVRVFEGTRHHLTELDSRFLPGSMSDALKIRHRPSMSRPGRKQGAELQKELYRQFFHHIDRVLRPLYAQRTEPLVVAGVDYLLPIFADVCTYRHLVEEGVPGNPEMLGESELHGMAWPLVENVLTARREHALAEFAAAAGTGRTATDLDEVLAAAQTGRVKTLFVDLDQDVLGTLDVETTARATIVDQPGPGVLDLASQAARWTASTGGRVFAGSADTVPGDGAVAALFRYA